NTGGPSRYYRRTDGTGRVGFISPHSHNFCDTCNRVRVTAEGRLLLCLGQEHSMDLRRILRGYPTEPARLREALLQSMDLKPQGHEFQLAAQPVIFRHMSVTGG
ncbi:MAG TPA: GTP 3',8-cyclase MoaA, partial [Thiolinea sp.]|nr:GTP 3',8-cyclase MoaA [Thiolinea sp.]